jgi:hypothetical protein
MLGGDELVDVTAGQRKRRSSSLRGTLATSNPVFRAAPGLLRCARNDVEGPAETGEFVIARSARDNPGFLRGPWIASRSSQ